MRLLAIYNSKSGADYHRIYMPMRYMELKDGDEKTMIDLSTRKLDPEDLEEPQIVFINRELPYKAEIIKKFKDFLGFKLVVDIDDYWELYPDHPLYKTFKANNTSDSWKSYMRLADAVTTTNQRLAEKVKEYNENVYVLPNAVPEVEQFTYFRRTEEKFQVIYTGGNSHSADVKLLTKSLDRMEAEKMYKYITLSYFNPSQFNTFSRFRGSFCKAPLPVTQYMKHYDSADLAIAPLQKNEFNSYKSNLKIIEAGIKRIPILVSNCHPYLDDSNPGIMKIENPITWYDRIDWLSHDINKTRELGELLYEYVKENYNFEKINRERYSVFEKILNGTNEK